jgi:hypothetical protein
VFIPGAVTAPPTPRPEKADDDPNDVMTGEDEVEDEAE